MTATADDFQSARSGGDGDTARLIVASHYEIDLEYPLGSGGMSVVYLGRDLRARRLVALRTLRPEYRRDPASRARFRQEARRMAVIQHPNVARVYDYREDDETLWAVIEYVPGDSLKDIVAREGFLAVDVVSGYLAQIADALAELHGRSLVHLDVKPQNLIVTDDGTVKLIDFGLAQPANLPQELIGGLAYGTAAYLSPEQASGEHVGPASDVYSLGCVIYELLTGRPPFSGDRGDERPHDTIRAHIGQMPLPPSQAEPAAEIPAWVDELVLWSLAKRPVDRFDDVRLFASLFAQGVEGELTASGARTIRNSLAHPIDTHLDRSPRPQQVLSGSDTSEFPGSPLQATARPAFARSRWPGRIWRLVFALLVANAILGGVLYLQRGTIPGLYDGNRVYRDGVIATVMVEGLNVRAEPGTSGSLIGDLSQGQRVEIIGEAVASGGERWWPVAFTDQGSEFAGYVWEQGLQADIETGRDRLEAFLDRQSDALMNRIGNR